MKVYELIERSPDDDGVDESDKHIEARDRRYSCLRVDLTEKCFKPKFISRKI